MAALLMAVSLAPMRTPFGTCGWSSSQVPAGAKAAAGVKLVTPACLSLARSGGWTPVSSWNLDVTGLREVAKRTTFSVPDGYPGPSLEGGTRTSDSERELLRPVARLFAAVVALSSEPRLCIVGDSIAEEAVGELHMARERMMRLMQRRDTYDGWFLSPMPNLRLHKTAHLGADCLRAAALSIGPALPCDRACWRQCDTQSQKWRASVVADNCTLVLLEPATAHHEGTEPNVTRSTHDAILGLAHSLSAAGRLPPAPTDDGTSMHLPAAETSAAFAALVRAVPVPASLEHFVAESARWLADWVEGAPERIAVIRSGPPHHFRLTGSYMPFHARPASSHGTTPFNEGLCDCPPMRADLAAASIETRAAAAVRSAVARVASSLVGFADVHLALSALPQVHALHLGCARSPSPWHCSSGMRAGAAGALRARLHPRPTEDEQAQYNRSADSKCDCLHMGFTPQKLAAWASVVADAANATAEAALRRTGAVRRGAQVHTGHVPRLGAGARLHTPTIALSTALVGSLGGLFCCCLRRIRNRRANMSDDAVHESEPLEGGGGSRADARPQSSPRGS